VEARETANSLLAFMMSSVPALQAEGWVIEVDSTFPYQIATPDSWYTELQPHAHLRSQSRARQREWFDLHLGVMVNGQPINLLPALVSYLQGATQESASFSCRIGDHLLIRLDDGRFLPVPIERIQGIADTLVELFDREDGLNDRQALSLPKSQLGRLAQLSLDSSSVSLRSNDAAALDFVKELRNGFVIQPLSAPDHFQATLRPYQQEGLGWLQFLRRLHLGGILADDMGLGKTVQVLAHLALEKQAGRLTRPSLIVAPVSVIGNWQQEIRRFTPELKLLTLHGAQRKEWFDAIDGADVIVTGYPSLQLDAEALLAHDLYFLVLDEAQMIKNPRAKVSQAARALRAEHRICLTGTPMENHLGELWSLFEFLQPDFLGDEKQFQRLYRTPIEKNGDRVRSAALARRVAPFILRRTKDGVAKDLPEKTQIVESIVLDERQRDFYDGIRLSMHRRVREVIQQQGLARSHITVLDALLKLRQACCDPRLVRDDAETRSIPSAKLDWLRTVLPELVVEGRRILLFSQFTSMLRLIESVVQELAIPYLMLTGETQRRAELVTQFQAGTAPVFLISLKAGGTGLNLTAADTVIHYDPWWNPAAEAQATDRAHRIGQDKPVFVYKLIAQGTVEEKIMQLQADKYALAEQLFDERNASPARLSAADWEGLFAP
jgi:SNF2 family DNA or RNA helicase